MTQIAEATGEGLETVRDFLDSRHGRHFADDVGNELDPDRPVADAVDAATQRWMGWTIRRQASKEYGIPRGLPYLTGFAIHAGNMAEEELECRVSLVNPSGGSCRRTDSLLGDSLCRPGAPRSGSVTVG